MTDDLRIGVEFTAEVADAIAKIEALKAAIDSVGGQRSQIGVSGVDQLGRDVRTVANEADNASRSMDNLGQRASGAARQGRRDFQQWMSDMQSGFPKVAQQWEAASASFRSKFQNATDGMAQDFRDRFVKKVEADADKSFDNIVAKATSSGGAAGSGWANAFAAAAGGADKFFKSGAGNIAAGVGASALLGGPLLAGLGGGLVAGSLAAAPGIVGSLAAFPLLKDAMGEVTKAATALETQTNNYNNAADKTAILLSTDNQAMKNYHQLLGEVTPTQAGVLKLLQQQNVAWTDLTPKQQAAVIQIRDTTNLYKALLPSQQQEVNALLAEHDAIGKLEPAQQQALLSYQAMHTAYDNLRTAAMPSLFTAVAAAEQAATDAMRPLLPLIQQTALGWTDMFNGLDKFVNSGEFQTFIDHMSGFARTSIDGFGKALGNLALGFLRIGDALSPMAKPFLDWLDRTTAAFANWPNTPKGMSDLQAFMADVRRDGPVAAQTIHELSTFVAEVVSAFASNPVALQVMNEMLHFLDWMAGSTAGQALLQLAAWAAVLGKIASALGLIKAVGGIAKLFEGGAAGTSGLVGGVGGLLGRAGGGGAVGAGGDVAGLVAGASPLAIAAGAAAVVGAIGLYGQHVKDASDKTAGVVQKADGSVSAASNVGNVQVSQAFKDMANSITGNAGNVHKAGGFFNDVLAATGLSSTAAFLGYSQKFKSSTDDLKTVMNLGRTQFGQDAGLFVNEYGGDVLKMGQAIQKSGKTLGQQLTDTAGQVFEQLGQQMPGFWDKFQQNTSAAGKQAFQDLQKNSAGDYGDLKSKLQQLEDDLKNGRGDKAKQDFQDLGSSMDKFMTDAVKGNIDTGNTQIYALGQDINKYIQDMAKGDSQAAAADIAQMQKDVAGDYQSATSGMSAAAQAALSQSLTSWQSYVAGLNLGNIPGTSTPINKGMFADGGLFRGAGGPRTDSNLIAVSDHEFIVNAAATRANLPLLEAINSGKMKGFKDGGTISGLSGRLGISDEYFNSVASLSLLSIAAQNLHGQMTAAMGGSRVASINNAQLNAAIMQAMGLTGVGGLDWLTGIGIIIDHESGGNVNAINLTDINAQHGDPSRGLMQLIGATFSAYHQPGTSGNIYDPVANISAGIRYIEGRYGGIDNVPGVRSVRSGGAYLPYDEGGWLMQGVHGVVNATGKPEAVLNPAQSDALVRMASGGGVTVPVVVTIDGQQVYRAVRKAGWQTQRNLGQSAWASD